METDDRPAQKCVTLPRRHTLFFVLVLGVVVFFYYTGVRDAASDWNPQQWIRHHSTKLFIPFRKQSAVNRTTDGSEAKPTAAPASSGTTRGAELPQKTSTPSIQGPMTQRSMGLSSRVSVASTAQTPRRAPVPYVSPGPYLVEYPHEYQFTVNEPQRCEEDKPFVVLIVQVAPRNRAHREIIRGSWGSERLVDGKAVALFFLLGMQTGDDAQQVQQQLLKESRDHHDLIQSNFVDCYKNLTIKTMVMMEWLDSYCSVAAYAMKIDSDMFLNVPNLVALLMKAPKTNYMTGLVAHGGEVLRDPKSKWYLPEDLFSEPVYPPYTLGLGYILSLDLTRKLIEASRHVRAFYIEDVFVGLCMRQLGVRPTDPPSWDSFHVFPLTYSRCSFSKIIATTVQENVDRVWLWTDFKRPGLYC